MRNMSLTVAVLHSAQVYLPPRPSHVRLTSIPSSAQRLAKVPEVAFPSSGQCQDEVPASVAVSVFASSGQSQDEVPTETGDDEPPQRRVGAGGP